MSTGPIAILLVRHGATDWSISGQHTGRTDLALNDIGRRQATSLRSLLRTLVDGRPAVVFSSPLIRASATCELAGGGEPEIVDALAEFDYGDYEGMTTHQIHDLVPGWNLFRDGCPGGESVAAVTARCDAFVAKAERMAQGKVVIAFTHGHLSRILTARLLGLRAEDGEAFYNETASVGIIETHRDKLVLNGWNVQAPPLGV